MNDLRSEILQKLLTERTAEHFAPNLGRWNIEMYYEAMGLETEEDLGSTTKNDDQ